MENNLDKQYTDLLQDILDNGVTKKDRTGTGTISVFGRTIRHKMSEGFPILTTKKLPFKLVIIELLWFLRGETNIKFLVDNNCHIWDGDAFKNYISKTNEFKGDWPDTQEEFINKIKTDDEFAKKWGNLGPIYGKQWRKWDKFIYDVYDKENNSTFKVEEVQVIDQLQNSINLLKTDPDSRRNKVTSWNVGEIKDMVLPPCHTDFQFYTRELDIEYRAMLSGEFNENTIRVDQFIEIYGMRLLEQKLDEYNIPKRAISLMFNMRSSDVFLGLPFNIASYGLLLEIVAKIVNMVPDELIGNLGDTHLYLNHIEQAKEQIGRKLSLEERIRIYALREGQTYEEFVTNWDTEKQWLEDLSDTTIPTRTREPFPLPTLNHLKIDYLYKILSEDLSLITHLDNTDFVLENYQSHPTIKAPLSN